MSTLSAKVNRNVKILFLLISATFLCVFTAVLCYCQEAAEHVVINEVCSNNFSVICDENGNYSDYVELYNPAFVPVSMTGFSLSDNADELQKCSLESVIIPAKGYLLVWLDGSGENIVGHASFKISREGEKIYLSNRYGKITDCVDVPKLSYNTVFARVDDGLEMWDNQTPTAGITNKTAKGVLKKNLAEPGFSVESGFYDNAFELEITADKDEVIYYTLDGSEPDIDSMHYTGPISITDASVNENVYSARTDLMATMEYVPEFKVDKAVIVRAMAYDPDSNTVSKSVTKTYFVGFNKKEEYDGYSVLSLVMDPDDLFDTESGIYGNGAALEAYQAAAGLENGEVPDSYQDEDGNIYYKYMSTNAYYRGREWEREAEIAYFDEEHALKLNQSAGIRISGESTRNAAQKSFNIYARDIYDKEGVLDYNFFGNMEYSSIKLRNGGSDHQGSKIYDAFLQALSEDRNVSIQASRPCVVFLNGEYWGIYNIRERYKEEYFFNHYGISENNVWMIDSGSVSIGSWEAWNAYNDVLQFIDENDMTNEDNYRKACGLIDMQSLIDWYCIQLYINNKDTGFDKNIAVWRSIRTENGEYGDGRWRFMLYDLDGALGDPMDNTFEDSEWWKKEFDLMDEKLIKSLLKNENFRKQFLESFMETADIVFNYESVHERLMEWKERYQTQTVKSHQRFLSSEIGEKDYDIYIERIDDFFKKRRNYVIPYLEEELKKY